MTSFYEQLPLNFNVGQYFIEKNIEAARGTKVAYYYQDQTFTYESVYHYIRRMAGLIKDLGIDRENRIAILLPDSPELVFTFWGALWAGCVPVPINTAYSKDNICYIIEDCRARLLVTTQQRYEQMSPHSSQFLRHVICVDGRESLRLILEHATFEPEAAETCRDEPAFWLYTSGSTGRPKGVIHVHHSMVVCAEYYAQQTLALKEDDISYSVAKIPFAYGLGNTLYMPMAVGASSVLSSAIDTFEFIDDIHKYRPTILWAIPSTYASILALSHITPLNTSSLRLCVSAAEQLPEAIWHKFKEEYNLEICEGIGTTELLHIFLSNRPGACRPGTSGRPVPGYLVQVVGASGELMPAGQIGDLEVTAESLMLGYWNRLSETRRALYGSTMHTGDKYMVDEDGYFRFMGRGDDLFKVNGQWVSPMEVEGVLLKHPAILDCAVISERSENHGLSSVTAYVGLKPGHPSTPKLAAEIRQFARKRLPHFKSPKSVHILDSLPRTATGKVDRKQLRQLQVVH